MQEPATKIHELPQEGYVRLKTILRVFPVSAATWWRGVAAGKYPPPTPDKLGPKITAWRAVDIQALINGRWIPKPKPAKKKRLRAANNERK